VTDSALVVYTSPNAQRQVRKVASYGRTEYMQAKARVDLISLAAGTCVVVRADGMAEDSGAR
jgi:hypothetical protein